MPSVISKYLRSNGVPEKFIGNREYLSKALIASSLILYGCKISYPIIKKVCHPSSESRKDETDNRDEDEKFLKTDIDVCLDDSDDGKPDKVDNNNKTCVLNGNLIRDKCYQNDSEKTDADYQHDPLDSKKRNSKARTSPAPSFDKEFLQRLYKLLKIMIPQLFCVESGLLFIHTCALSIRTFLSIYVASMEGLMVKFIVRRDVNSFAYMLLKWLIVALPATFINSLIRYLESKLALSFRSRLVKHAYRLYFKDETYYRIGNVDDRIENADHCLTDDISSFSNSVAHLYSHVTKPLFDCALIGIALIKSSQRMGAATIPGPMLAFLMITLTGEVLRVVSPKFGAMVAEEAQRKGDHRHVHTRIINNAEEIAFYGGHEVELEHLEEAYESLVEQRNRILRQKLWYIVLEQFLMKYVWSGTGMVIVSIPILTGLNSNKSREIGISERTQYFTTARNLLLNGGDAVERLMSSYKEIVELAGYTHRVSEMFDVFRNVADGKYVRKNIVAATKQHPLCPLQFNSEGQILPLGVVENSTDGSIVVTDVPIVTPNGDVVVPSLSLTINKGNHLLITGPNGCGKSSFFRILSGLWPVYHGTLVKPSGCSMFYIPQRPYMSLGNLREQVIYPDTLKKMQSKGFTDEDLIKCLERVQLSYLVTREGSWEAKADWKDVLSGGEKQRMAIARLFYHRPSFALLDECTSAVSMDVESNMYQAAKDEGITLLTITHRPSLWKFHTQILKFDGEGGWKLEPLIEGNVVQEANGDDSLTEKSTEKTEL